ncbi:hypothetical protein [Embleya sp. NPDC059237]|uniref:hypothetical protein n=1 Tax=Embleya sp. NPDC059237 TaxID=3346784 RepID=UPI0036A4651B
MLGIGVGGPAEGQHYELVVYDREYQAFALDPPEQDDGSGGVNERVGDQLDHHGQRIVG